MYCSMILAIRSRILTTIFLSLFLAFTTSAQTDFKHVKPIPKQELLKYAVGSGAFLDSNFLAKDPVLFTLDGDSVHVSEFLYVYNKNSMAGEEKYTSKSIEEYLDLYVNFRLKVREAEDMGMDTIQSLLNELETYRKQLAKSYLYDKDVSEHLITEAYERYQTELNVSHILIKIEEPGLPSDTLAAFKKAMQIRKRLLNGEDFATLAKQYSGDESAAYNGGNIGWFSALRTIYPFETACYNAKVGEITMPVRTIFGYHIIKVNDKRPARGEITVAHIMIQLPQNPTDAQVKVAKDRAYLAYNEAINGGDWDDLVTRYSQDKTTRKRGGELPPFRAGGMTESFEDAAYSLQHDGDISVPIQTEYGFHIIKRISLKPLPSFEEMKNDIKKRIERLPRADLAKQVLLDSIKREYGFKEYPKARNELFGMVNEMLQTNSIHVDDKSKLTKPIFKIADKSFTQADMATFLEQNHKKRSPDDPLKVFMAYYDKFVESTLLAYEESKLDDKYPEFRMLMQEYRDGILLFELTNRKVWTKAVKDTAGLAAFYETIKGKYMWPKRLSTVTYTVNDPKLINKVRKVALKKGKAATLTKFNKKTAVVTAKSNLFAEGDDPIADTTPWEPGLTENINNSDGTITFTQVVEVVPPTPKTLNEARGFIVSDYQEYLEKQWIKDLRNKYKVDVDKAVLNALINK